MSLVIGAPVRRVNQKGDRRESFLGTDQGIHQQKRMEINEQARVQVQVLSGKSFHQRTLRVMLNRILGVRCSAQEAFSMSLETTRCGPAVPHGAEDRRLHPRSHQCAQLSKVMEGCPSVPIFRALPDRK